MTFSDSIWVELRAVTDSDLAEGSCEPKCLKTKQLTHFRII